MGTRHISDQIIEAYLDCRYKSYLKLHNNDGEKTDYENLQYRLDKRYQKEATGRLESDYLGKSVLFGAQLGPATLSGSNAIIFNASAEIDGLVTSFDAAKRSSEESNRYDPILYCRFPKITVRHKTLLAYKAIILCRLQRLCPDRGFIIYGDSFSMAKVRLQPHIERAYKIIERLQDQISMTAEVQFFLNSHCEICEFSVDCRNKAIESDHISLLRGMSAKEIDRHGQKGIFTVNQLSYTFRPRKRQKRSKSTTYRHYFSLQALSIRENKIHIHGTPEQEKRGYISTSRVCPIETCTI